MAVTVLQRIASMQQIGLILVPAIKGAVYINTHCNYSQPELTKLYNDNIGGYPYTFTAGDIHDTSVNFVHGRSQSTSRYCSDWGSKKLIFCE